MAYGPQFTFEFLEAYTEGLGYTPGRYKVTLSRKDYTGGLIAILPGAKPLELEWQNGGDDEFAPIIQTQATLELACEQYWQAEALFVRGDTDMQVLVEFDPTGTGTQYAVAFMGFLIPDYLRETFGPKPYYVSVKASDGLSRLDTLPVVDTDGKRLSGQLALSTILQNALAQTGLSRPMTTGVNLFELADMATGQLVDGRPNPTKDPLNRTLVSNQWLITDDGETLSSEAALKGVLEAFGCRLAQVQGDWYVLRVVEQPGGHDPYDGSGETIATRRYNTPNDLSAGPVTGGFSSQNLRVYVGPKDSNAELVRVLDGGPITSLREVKQVVRVEQQFGRYLSRLPYSDLSTLDPATGLPPGWVRKNLSPTEGFVQGAGTELSPKELVIYGAGHERMDGSARFISTQIDYPQVGPEFEKQLTRTLKAKFKLVNLRGAQVCVLANRLNDTGRLEQYILQAEGNWKASPGKKDMVTLRTDYFYTSGSPARMKSKEGWADLSITSKPINRVVSLLIFFCWGEALDKIGDDGRYLGPETGPPAPYIRYKDIRLEVEQEGLNRNGTGRTVSRNPRVKPQAELVALLGDVPEAADGYSRAGTLYKANSTPVVTTKWYEAYSSAVSGTDPGATLLETRLSERTRQRMNDTIGFEGDLIGRLPYGPMSVLLFGGLGETDSFGLFQHYPMVLTRWRLSCRETIHSIVARRIYRDRGALAPATTPAPVAVWLTSGGDEPMNIDPVTGLVVEPPKPQLGGISSIIDLIRRISKGFPILTIGPQIDGYVPLSDGAVQLTANVFNGTSLLGTVKSAGRAEFDFNEILPPTPL